MFSTFIQTYISYDGIRKLSNMELEL
jgi:hypothetical protein